MLCSRLPEVAATHANVLHLVLSHLPPGGASRLRHVSRVMRTAVNRSVSTVTCGLSAPRFSSELANKFPEADRLRVDLTSDCDRVSKQDVMLFCDYISVVSPKLASKIRVVELVMHSTLTFDSVEDAVTSFVSRCTSLQEMHVHFQADRTSLDEHFKLQGQGRTNQERRRSMQQQLAALQASSSFLAPASWASTQCLTSLRLDMGSARHDASYLEAAMQAPSLVELHVSTAEAGSTATILPSVSRLSNLTHLAIVAADPGQTIPQRATIEAITKLSRLQSLRIDEWILGMDEDVAAIPACWARLASLTQMCVQFCTLDLQHFAGLRSLRELGLANNCHAVGSIATLLPLTGLTSLIGPDEVQTMAEMNQYFEGAEDDGQVVVPQQWKEGLRRLDWPTCSGATMGVVSQLTALTELKLEGVHVSFEACRALGKLAHLQQLRLHVIATDEGGHYSPEASKYRPSWPSLNLVMLSSEGIGLPALHALARWTDIPTACSVHFLCCIMPSTGHLAVKGWGAGWMHAALCDQHHRCLPAVLVDDDDVATYVGALERLDGAQLGFRHHLCVGSDVSPAGFRRLAAAAELPDGALIVNEEAQGPFEGHVIGWRGSLALKTEYFKAVSAVGGGALPALQTLRLAHCTLLSDRDVALLASAAPGLKRLKLQHAARLTDAALYALLGCQRLEWLTVTGAAKVTASGVLALLTLCGALVEVDISGPAARALYAMAEQVAEADPDVAGLWADAAGGGGVSWTKLGSCIMLE